MSPEHERARPHVREAGSGPAVVCLHANASNSSQWRELSERLAPRYRVLAPDLYGCGRSPEWPSPTTITLADEAALIEPALAGAAPFALVGHSYGGAVALIAALADPARIRALVLFEPTFFSLVDAVAPRPNGVEGIRRTVDTAAAALARGDRDAAAEAFIDYWMGAGSWRATPDPRKPAIAESMVNVRRWAHALVADPTPLSSFRRLEMPVLYLTGARSPESAHAVAEVLVPALPRVRVVRLAGVGHMAPLTHPALVNDEIARFLDRV